MRVRVLDLRSFAGGIKPGERGGGKQTVSLGFEAAGRPPWLPFPTDRDMAFADYDGFLLSVARAGHPVLVVYEREYPRILGLAWNSREVDRRFLSRFERAAFREVAAELQREISDEVMARAVHRG